jgi:hypothetical protein
MTAYITVTLRVAWEGEDVARYDKCMEFLRYGIEDEARYFLENEEYTEASVVSCEAVG